MKAEELGTDAPHDRGTAIMITLAVCGTIVSLQQTMIVPLLPELPGLLGTSVDNATWLVTATLLTGAVSTPVISRLADLHGKRRLILICLVIMIIGSLLGAVFHDLVLLIIARSLQGVGMALIPVGLAMMRDVLPPRRLPLGVSLMSATLAIGAGTGLPLAGWLVEAVEWYSIFWATAALGLLLLLTAVMVLPGASGAPGGRFDLTGAALFSTGLALLLLVLSKGGQWGWLSPAALGTLTGGLVCLALWVPWSLRTPHPIIDIRTSARPAVALVNACAVLTGFGMFANMLITTQILQLPAAGGLGMTTFHAGLWMAPSAIAFGLFAPVAASMTRRIGATWTLLAGAASMSFFYIMRVMFSDTLFEVVLGSILVSAGTSLAFAAMPVLIMRAVPVTETSAANGLNTLLRSLGTSTSSATLAAVGAASTITVAGVVYPSADVFTTLFWIAASASALAAVAALALPRPQTPEELSDAAQR